MGSYEVSKVQRGQIAEFFDRVTWVYTAERNLEKFHQFGFETEKCQLVPNGVPRRLSAKPVTRGELGIPDAATVFLFAARSHPDKGWLQLAEAFDRLVGETDGEAHLLMVGEGPEADLIGEQFADNSHIHMPRFRADVDGSLLRAADYSVAPTRFSRRKSMPA